MNTPRRSFFLGAAALLAAPAIARASSLMPVSTLNPMLWGDGIHDDTAALQRLFDRGTRAGAVNLPRGNYLINKSLVAHSSRSALISMGDALIICDKSFPRNTGVIEFRPSLHSVSIHDLCFKKADAFPQWHERVYPQPPTVRHQIGV